ncbi:MAG: radical SAM protein [Deltaproteobacteria bacterium]|nr:radical SAM protein [Deltaproteobacteria bacterium]
MKKRPKLLFADDEGTIYDHPYLEMVGCSGTAVLRPSRRDLVRMPDMSRLYFHPDCPPYGYDPEKKCIVCLRETSVAGKNIRCNAVSAFIQQGWVRQLLPAMDYTRKGYTLPMWAYSAVGHAGNSYHVPAFEIDDNRRWDPSNFDDRGLPSLVAERLKEFPDNRLVKHLARCAVEYHCFAAKNFFHRRWEAPIPTSPTCNSGCLGCISQQPDSACMAPQERIAFVPETREIVEPFIRHLNEAADPIISFGQGCEGEPIIQWQRISEAIRAIRKKTSTGTINLNTNASIPDRVRELCDSGLDSIRISINSARKELYTAYYQPRGYRFEDVMESIRIAVSRGVFTMINYLIFPGITDHTEEISALKELINETNPHLIHFKNLNIDPDFYLSALGRPEQPGQGLKNVCSQLLKEFPNLQLGYFNRTKDQFFPPTAANTTPVK